MKEERRLRRRDGAATAPELRAVFHRLWGKAVGKPEYDKREWIEFRKLMFRLTGVEL